MRLKLKVNKVEGWKLKPREHKNGKRETLIVNAYQNLVLKGVSEEVAKKIIPMPPIQLEEMQECTGTYYCKELDTRYTIIIRDNKLVVTHRRHSDFLLERADVDQFTSDMWFFRSVTFLRDKLQKVTGFKISGERARNIVFIKERIKKWQVQVKKKPGFDMLIWFL